MFGLLSPIQPLRHLVVDKTQSDITVPQGDSRPQDQGQKKKKKDGSPEPPREEPDLLGEVHGIDLLA